jgi:hypothetical protein
MWELAAEYGQFLRLAEGSFGVIHLADRKGMYSACVQSVRMNSSANG